jgi:hypothetical protein
MMLVRMARKQNEQRARYNEFYEDDTECHDRPEHKAPPLV